MSTSSDSSTEDDNREKLLEAADIQFLNSLFQKKSTEETSQEAEETEKPSWKKINQDDGDDFNYFHGTPGFRDYVSKHIEKTLEKSILYIVNEKEGNGCKKRKKKKRKKGGVKLLTDSVDVVSVEDSDLECKFNTIKRPKVKRRDIENGETKVSEYEKVKSVAVSVEDVLNQRGTEYWTSKNKVYKYKQLKDGTLVSID